MESAGLNDDGLVQTFHTQNVLRRMVKYMPYQSGALIKLTIAQTDIRKPFILTKAPQAYYLYRGKVFVDPLLKAAGFMTQDGWKSRKGVSKVATDRDLKFDTAKNAGAGAQWDKRLLEKESDIITSELQAFIDRTGRRGNA